MEIFANRSLTVADVGTTFGGFGGLRHLPEGYHGEEHAQAAEPESGQRKHRCDGDRPAPVSPGPPDDEGDGDRQPYPNAIGTAAHVPSRPAFATGRAPTVAKPVAWSVQIRPPR